MGGAHTENVGEDRNVGGEGEVVVGYSQGHGQALDSVIAKQAFTSTAKRKGVEGVGGVRVGGGGRTGRDRTKQAQRDREKKKPGVSLICRAWHAVRNISLSCFVLDRPRSGHGALSGVMQEILTSNKGGHSQPVDGRQHCG